MMLPTSILALTHLILSLIPSSPTTPSPEYLGDLPTLPPSTSTTISSCTFALGPPSPPPSYALCASLTAFCTRFRESMRSRRISTLKTRPLLSPKETDDNDDDDNPLKNVSFRTGCTGGTTTTSDGSHLSAYTATCIVDGTDWIPYVFMEFLKAEFTEPLPIKYEFIGCQIPTHM